MKKLIGISLVALFAAMPMMAGAAGTDPVTDVEPTASATGPAAAAAPKYALAAANTATDNNAASAGYVKGAYNAAIKAVNKVHESKQDKIDSEHKLDVALVNGAVTSTDITNAIDALDATVSTANDAALAITVVESEGKLKSVSGSINDSAVTSAKIADGTITATDIANSTITATQIAQSTITSEKLSTAVQASLSKAESALQSAAIANMATKSGVLNTIESATGTVTLDSTNGLTVAGTPTGTITNAKLSNTAVTVSATMPTSVPIMVDWANDSASSTGLALNTASTTLNGSVTSDTVTADFSGSGITGGKATGTISGIDVKAPASYQAD